jgi:hypothetical protein
MMRHCSNPTSTVQLDNFHSLIRLGGFSSCTKPLSECGEHLSELLKGRRRRQLNNSFVKNFISHVNNQWLTNTMNVNTFFFIRVLYVHIVILHVCTRLSFVSSLISRQFQQGSDCSCPTKSSNRI